MTLLAAVLAASGPVYAQASRIAAVQQTINIASPNDAAVVVSGPADAVQIGVGDQLINRAVAPAQATVRHGALSRTFTVAGQPDEVLTEFLAADGFAQDAELVAGRWPDDGAGSPDDVPVALPVAAAEGLGLAVGDRVSVTGIRTERELRVHVVGLFQLESRASVLEGADGLLRAGVVESGGFRTHGPMVVGLQTLLQQVEPDDATLRWWATLRPDSVYPDDLNRVARSVNALMDSDAEAGVRVESSLPDLLSQTARSTALIGSTVAIALLQLVIVALAALVLVGGALADERRGQAGLLRSRGAGVTSVAVLAAAEAALLAIPAALLGPPLAMLLVRLIGSLPPPLGPGLSFPLILPGLSWLAAIVAVVGCVVGLSVAAALAARSLVAARTQRSGRPTAAAVLVAGGDAMLIGLAVVGLWQLRGYRGDQGLDAALIAAPAIGLLAVLALGLRLLTRLLSLSDSMAGRSRGLWALAIRSVARRRGAAMRVVALPLLAVSTGVLALTTNASWQTVQQDRAAFRVGADLRGDVVRGYPSQVDDIAGVTGATPVWSSPIATVDDVPSGRFVAIDADTAGQVVPLRSDLVEGTWPAAAARLGQARPTVPVVAVPDGTTSVTAAVRGSDSLFETVLPRLVLRDRFGLFHDVAATLRQTGPGQGTVQVQIPPGGGWALAALQINVRADLTRPEVQMAVGPLRTDAGTKLDDSSPWLWQPSPVRDVRVPAEISELSADQRQPGDLLGVRFLKALTTGSNQRVPVLRAVPGPTQDTDSIPVLASPSLTQRLDGQTSVPLRVRDLGLTLQGDVVGSITAFPPDVSTQDLVIADLRTVAAVAFAADGRGIPAEELLITSDTAGEELLGELTATRLFRGPPLDRRELRAADRTDPLAAGLLGALMLTTVGAAAAGAVGFGVAARSAVRGRRVELSALRALGVSTRQLRRSLLTEQALLLGFAVAAGVVGGLVLAAAFVPAALPPGVLPPLLDVPAGLITVLVLALLGVIAGAAVALGGTGHDVTAALRQGEDDG